MLCFCFRLFSTLRTRPKTPPNTRGPESYLIIRVEPRYLTSRGPRRRATMVKDATIRCPATDVLLDFIFLIFLIFIFFIFSLFIETLVLPDSEAAHRVVETSAHSKDPRDEHTHTQTHTRSHKKTKDERTHRKPSARALTARSKRSGDRWFGRVRADLI